MNGDMRVRRNGSRLGLSRPTSIGDFIRAYMDFNIGTTMRNLMLNQGMLELDSSRVVSRPRGFETPRGSFQATGQAQ